MLMTQEEVYTIEEVAKILKVSEETVRRLIASGDLDARRVGRQYRITRESINKFLGRS
jgi:putative molybdopterin biosynthesis protein